jgi:hypothetical protein
MATSDNTPDDGPDPPAGDGHQPEPAPDDNDDPTITKYELAARIGGTCTPKTVVRRWKEWGLHPLKICGELHFYESDVRAFFKRRRLGND